MLDLTLVYIIIGILLLSTLIFLIREPIFCLILHESGCHIAWTSLLGNLLNSFGAVIFAIFLLIVLFSLWTLKEEVFDTWKLAITLKHDNQKSKRFNVFLKTFAVILYLFFGYVLNIVFIQYCNISPINEISSFQILAGLYSWKNVLVFLLSPTLFFLTILIPIEAILQTKSFFIKRSQVKRERFEMEQLEQKQQQQQLPLSSLKYRNEDYQELVMALQQKYIEFEDLCITIASHSIASNQDVYSYMISYYGDKFDDKSIKDASAIVKILGGGKRPLGKKELIELVDFIESNDKLLEVLRSYL